MVKPKIFGVMVETSRAQRLTATKMNFASIFTLGQQKEHKSPKGQTDFEKGNKFFC